MAGISASQAFGGLFPFVGIWLLGRDDVADAFHLDEGGARNVGCHLADRRGCRQIVFGAGDHQVDRPLLQVQAAAESALARRLAGSDLRHLVKATYYVSDTAADQEINSLVVEHGRRDLRGSERLVQ